MCQRQAPSEFLPSFLRTSAVAAAAEAAAVAAAATAAAASAAATAAAAAVAAAARSFGASHAQAPGRAIRRFRVQIVKFNDVELRPLNSKI